MIQAIQRTTAADWAPYFAVSLLVRVYSAIRSTWVMLVVDNPFLWYFGLRGSGNILNDIEGERGRRVIQGLRDSFIP